MSAWERPTLNLSDEALDDAPIVTEAPLSDGRSASTSTHRQRDGGGRLPRGVHAALRESPLAGSGHHARQAWMQTNGQTRSRTRSAKRRSRGPKRGGYSRQQQRSMPASAKQPLSPLDHAPLPQSMQWDEIRQLSMKLGIQPTDVPAHLAEAERRAQRPPQHAQRGPRVGQGEEDARRSLQGSSLVHGESEAMRYKLALEEMRNELAEETERRSELDQQCRSLSQRLSQLHAEYSRTIREKDQSHEREIIRLEEHFSERLTQLQQDQRARASSSTEETKRGTPSGSYSDRNQLDGRADVFDRLQSLSEEFQQAQREWERTRDDLEQQVSEERSARDQDRKEAEQAKADSEEQLQHTIQLLERQLTDMARDVSVAKEREQDSNRQMETLRGEVERAVERANAQESELEAARREAREAEQRAHNAETERRKLRAAILSGENPAAALEENGDDNGVHDSKADAAPAPATSTSQGNDDPLVTIMQLRRELRQMQQDWERACQGQQEAERLRSEAEERFQKRENALTAELASVHRAHSLEVQTLHNHVDSATDAHREEARTLHSRIQRLQSSLRETQGELDRTRTQLSSAEEKAARATAEASGKTDQYNSLTRRWEAVCHVLAEREGIDPSSVESHVLGTIASSPSHQATQVQLQKLENEVAYCKQQWDEELTCRHELEEALRAAQQETVAAQQALEEKEEDLEQKEEVWQSRIEAQRASLQDQLDQLQSDKAVIAGERTFLQRQIEQLSSENDRQASQQREAEDEAARLRGAVESLERALGEATDQAQTAHGEVESVSSRHETSLRAAHQALEDVKRRSDAKISGLLEENGQLRQEVSDLTEQVAHLQGETVRRAREADRYRAADRMGRLLHAWVIRRQAGAVAQWRASLAWQRGRAEALEEGREDKRVALDEAQCEHEAAENRIREEMLRSHQVSMETLAADWRRHMREVQGMAAEDARSRAMQWSLWSDARVAATKERLNRLFREETESLKEAFETSKREALQAVIEEKERIEEEYAGEIGAIRRGNQEALQRLREQKDAEIDEALEERDARHGEAMEEVVSQMQQQVEETTSTLLERKEKEKDDAVAEMEALLEDRVAEARNQVRAQMERMEERLEGELDELESDRTEWRNAAEEAQQTVKRLQGAGAALRLRLLWSDIRAFHQQRALRQSLRQLRDELDETRRRASRAETRLSKCRQLFVLRARRLEDMRESMRDSLTSSKRQQLMDHKVRSARVSRELSELEERERELEEAREERVEEVERTELGVRAKEQELRDMSEQSNITEDGRVDLHVSRKKRRLHAEHQRLTESLQEAKDQVRTVTQELQDVDAQRQDKEREMRDIERSLMGILMEQQKSLLGIIKATGDPHFDLYGANRHSEAYDAADAPIGAEEPLSATGDITRSPIQSPQPRQGASPPPGDSLLEGCGQDGNSSPQGIATNDDDDRRSLRAGAQAGALPVTTLDAGVTPSWTQQPE